MWIQRLSSSKWYTKLLIDGTNKRSDLLKIDWRSEGKKEVMLAKEQRMNQKYPTSGSNLTWNGGGGWGKITTFWRIIPNKGLIKSPI